MHQQHIADRLRHLLAVDVEKAVVQPVARENLAAMRAGRLRDLVLVVRKDQVVTAAVNIDGLAKQRFGHRRALDMRSEEHTSELQSLMRTSYAVFCLKKKIK